MSKLLFIAICILAQSAAATEPLGRFFFTPAERAQLDAARTQKQRPPPAAPSKVEITPAPQIISYSGIVRRSDGKSILWLNNRPAEEHDALSGLAVTGRVGADGAVTLHVPETGSSVRLKVGQRAELQTGRVAEGRPAPQSTPGANAERERSTPAEHSAPPAGSPVTAQAEMAARAAQRAEEKRARARTEAK